jgi:multidrug resistance protein, MATE family
MPSPPSTSLRAELRVLVALALPIAVAQLGLTSLSLVDTAIIGRTSVRDLAGAALGRTLFFATASIGMGVSYALDPLASQAVGAGRPDRAWEALRTTLRALALVAVPTLLMSFALTFVLVPLGVEADLVPRARMYLLGQTPGLFGFFAFLAGKTFLQAHGQTRPALIGAAAANLVNPIACNLLVRGDDALAAVGLAPRGLPRLGTFGAGLAGSIACLLLAGIVLRAAWEHRPADGPREAVPTGRVLRLGIPVGSQLLAEIGVFSLAGILAGRLGADVLSAHQIALGLASFSFMGALGVGGATAVRVGHAVGAGASPRRAGLVGLGLGAAVMSVGALLFAAIPHALMRVFTRDPAVIATGVSLLRIAAIFQLVDGLQVVAAGALRGAGDVRFPFLANVGAHWLIGLPVALWMSFGLGLGAAGLWWGLTAGLVAIAALLCARFLRVSRAAIERV